MNRPINPLADPDVLRQILNLLPIDRDDDPDGETLPLPTDNHRPNHTDKPDDALDYEFAVGDAVAFLVKRKGEPDETLTGTITGEGKRTSGATYAVVEVVGLPHPVRVPMCDLQPATDKARKRRPVANAVYRGEDPLNTTARVLPKPFAGLGLRLGSLGGLETAPNSNYPCFRPLPRGGSANRSRNRDGNNVRGIAMALPRGGSANRSRNPRCSVKLPD